MSGKRVYDDFVDALARLEITPESDLRVVPGESPTTYYEHASRTIVLGMPNPQKISGRLHWLMIARLVGASGVDDAIAHLGAQLPVLVAHEVTHHLRHRYDAHTESNFVEEQVANLVAIAFVNEHPAFRGSLKRLSEDAAASRARLSSVSPSTVPRLQGFRLEVMSILAGPGELSRAQLAEMREVADDLELPLEEVMTGFGGISKAEIRRALKLRAESERYFNLHYMASLSEYALFFSDWYGAYLSTEQIPTLAEAVERYLLTPEWERAERDATIAFIARAAARTAKPVVEATVQIGAEEFGRDALPILRTAAAGEHPAARAAALRYAAALELDDPAIERIAKRCLSSSAADTCAGAAAFILTVGSGSRREARALLDEMLDDDDRDRRRAALVAIVDACPGRFDRALTASLDSGDPTDRVLGLRGIESLPASPAFGTLASALLSDPDDQVRRAAAACLRTHPPSLGPLVDALDDPDWSVRQRAAEALARHAPAAGAALAQCRSLRLELMVAIALSDTPSSGALRRAASLLRRAVERRRMLLAARASIRGRSPAAQILRVALAEAGEELWELILRLAAARTRSKSASHAVRGLESPDRNQRAVARRIGEKQLSQQLSDLGGPCSDAFEGVEHLLADEDPALRLLSAEYLALR